MINDGYPLEYIRGANGEEIYIAINPTQRQYEIKQKAKTVLAQENVEIKEKTIKLKKYSFIVMKR